MAEEDEKVHSTQAKILGGVEHVVYTADPNKSVVTCSSGTLRTHLVTRRTSGLGTSQKSSGQIEMRQMTSKMSTFRRALKGLDGP